MLCIKQLPLPGLFPNMPIDVGAVALIATMRWLAGTIQTLAGLGWTPIPEAPDCSFRQLPTLSAPSRYVHVRIKQSPRCYYIKLPSATGKVCGAPDSRFETFRASVSRESAESLRGARTMVAAIAAARLKFYPFPFKGDEDKKNGRTNAKTSR